MNRLPPLDVNPVIQPTFRERTQQWIIGINPQAKQERIAGKLLGGDIAGKLNDEMHDSLGAFVDRGNSN